MAPRLRDLIATLQDPAVADTDLHRFATRFDADVPNLPGRPAAAQVQKLKSDIIAHASVALVAQATFSRQSVLALLGDPPGAARPN